MNLIEMLYVFFGCTCGISISDIQARRGRPKIHPLMLFIAVAAWPVTIAAAFIVLAVQKHKGKADEPKKETNTRFH